MILRVPVETLLSQSVQQPDGRYKLLPSMSAVPSAFTVTATPDGFRFSEVPLSSLAEPAPGQTSQIVNVVRSLRQDPDDLRFMLCDVTEMAATDAP